MRNTRFWFCVSFLLAASVATFAIAESSRVVSAPDGSFRLRVPEHWVEPPGPAEGQICLASPDGETVVLVSSDAIADLADPSLPSEMQRTIDRLMGALQDVQDSGTAAIDVGGQAGLHHEMTGTVNETKLTYLLSMFEGGGRVYRFVAWSPPGRTADLRTALRHILLSCESVAWPEAQTQELSTLVVSTDRHCQIRCPSGWTREPDSGTSLSISSASGAIFEVEFELADTLTSRSLEAYWDAREATLRGNGVGVEAAEPIMVDGRPALLAGAKAVFDSYNMRYYFSAVRDGEYFYWITMVAPLAAFDREMYELFPRMLETLQLHASVDRHVPCTLWAAETDSLTLYLLGSVHLLRPSDFPLDMRLDDAFDEAEMVVFEMPIDSMDSPDVAARMMEMAQLPAGQTLEVLLSPQTFERYQATARRLGMDPRGLLTMRPSFVATVLGVVSLQRIGVSETGIDEYFHARAIQDSLPQAHFETVDEQMDLLFGLGPELGVQLLEATLDQVDSAVEEWDEMMEAWRFGDAAALDSLINKFMDPMPLLRERLLDARNRAWMEKIERWLVRDRDLLIVVGAGHLVGENGLVRQLEERGFRIRQL